MSEQEYRPTPQFNTTKLSSSYGLRTTKEILFRLLIFVMVITFCITMLPIAFAIFGAFYVLLIFCLSAIIVIVTVGLIFTIENNIVVRMWSLLDKLDMDLAVRIQTTGLPIAMGVMGAIMISLLVLVIIDRKNPGTGKGKYIAALSVGAVGLVFSLIALMVTYGSK